MIWQVKSSYSSSGNAVLHVQALLSGLGIGGCVTSPLDQSLAPVFVPEITVGPVKKPATAIIKPLESQDFEALTMLVRSAPSPREMLPFTVHDAQLNRLVNRLESFTKLPVGWEHEDSPPANRAHYAAALEFLSRLPSSYEVPKAMIAPDGTLGLFWDSYTLHAEVEFLAENSFSLYVRDRLGARRESFVPAVNIDQVDERWFADELAATSRLWSAAA